MSTDTSTFNTLDRDLSIRFDIPKKKSSRLMSIQNNNISQKSSTKSKSSRRNKQIENKKSKYVDVSNVSRNNFKDFLAFGNRAGYNYNTEQENDLRFSESTRRKILPDKVLKNIKKTSPAPIIDEDDIRGSTDDMTVMKLLRNQEILRQTKDKKMMDIGSNLITDTAAKIPKASSEYWDNTKRRNLDTSVYTDTPMKYGGRGFGDINTYDMLFNGIGFMTRQDNPDTNPRNWDDDRIYVTNHNYHYSKQHVTDILPCGVDTRYLNQKMV